MFDVAEAVIVEVPDPLARENDVPLVAPVPEKNKGPELEATEAKRV